MRNSNKKGDIYYGYFSDKIVRMVINKTDRYGKDYYNFIKAGNREIKLVVEEYYYSSELGFFPEEAFKWIVTQAEYILMKGMLDD